MTIRPTTLNTSTSSSGIPMGPFVSLQRGRLVPWAFLAAVATILGYLYADSLRFLGEAWLEDNNSHGPLIPLISLYLIWLRWNQVDVHEPYGAWYGLLMVAVGLFVYVVGEFAAMHAVVHISLWMVLVGLLACAIGLSGIRALAFPLVYLLAAIPPPVFLQYELSSRLQLWSSELGVGFLHALGVTAYREGNVIDLGMAQLQVVEACSGLRYLFPLLALSVLAVYLYRESLWKRAVLVASSIPLSILLNGFRIGVIGLLVGSYGQAAAEGFTHFFEGWIFFVASLALLCVEMWILTRIGSAASRRPFTELIGLPGTAVPGPSQAVHTSPAHMSPVPLLAGCGLLFLAILAVPSVTPKEFAVPTRESLVDFPLQLGAWQGAPAQMEQQYLTALQLDDYLLADYVDSSQHPVNVYLAYYQSSKKGRSSHSPKQCIPGGGWEITSFEPLRISQVSGAVPGETVNRVVIQKGGHKQIVYYWFKQRERWITSEYLVKFFLFWDSLTRHRADGALVRLTAEVGAGESEERADGRLQTMAGLVTPLLSRFVPD